jgi:hypothetical protein
MNARPTIEQTPEPDIPAPDIPDWLIPQPTREQRAIIEQGRRDAIAYQTAVFELILDDVLDHVARGEPVSTWFADDPRELDYAKFLRWIHSDDTRKNRYREAQKIGAEVISDQMIVIADGGEGVIPEDVARSTLRISTRRWLLGVWDRDRFGEKKQIDQNVVIDLGDAMRMAQERVQNRVIEGRAERIEE